MAKILLVEDDNNLREIYGARLTAEGYEIVSAPDGEEALAIAVKEKPDLIITDVMMPKISGFDMLDILRNAPETKDTKVIMMTALSQAEDKDRADKLGADLYLVKSQVTLEDVAAAVKKILGGESDAQAADTAQPAETPSPAPATTPAPVAPAEATPPPAPEPTVVPPPTPPAPEPEPAPAPEAPVIAPKEGTNEVKPADTASTPAAATPPPAPEPTVVPPPTPPAPEPEPPKPVAKKIEVTLPDSPDEAKPAEPVVTPTPSSPASAEEPSVGPNLAEALAEEEKNMGQTGDISDAPATSAPVSPTSVIKPSTPPEEETPPEPATPPSASDNPNTKVIQPLNDLTTSGPDLNELLAKEEAKEATSKTSETTPPAAGNTTASPPPDHPDDLSKISL